MMANAFALGYRRYEWKCNAFNQPSWQAALRLGFSYEGTFRQSRVDKGRTRDTAWFSVIDSEWPALQACFERWLAPDNFDEQGHQRLPLDPHGRLARCLNKPGRPWPPCCFCRLVCSLLISLRFSFCTASSQRLHCSSAAKIVLTFFNVSCF